MSKPIVPISAYSRMEYLCSHCGVTYSGAHTCAPRDRIVIDLPGLKTKPKNATRFASRGGVFAEAAQTKRIVSLVAAITRSKVPSARLGTLPTRATFIRISAGELDYGAVWEAAKPVWDGLAKGLGLDDDRELQRPPRGEVKQEWCRRREGGVRIELEWEIAP